MKAETIWQLSDTGGCPACDAGLVVHVTSDQVAWLCELHIEGEHR